MEETNILIETLINGTGIESSAVSVMRQAALVLVAALLSWLGGWLCRKFIVPSILRLGNRLDTKWTGVLFDKELLFMACNIIPAIIIWKLLPMIFANSPLVHEILLRATAVYITVMSAKLLTGFTDILKKTDMSASSATKQYMQSFCGILKIIILSVTAIVIVAILLDKNPMTLFAGLGATSAILMLVFKDTIEGLVAGIRLTSNGMLHKGEWITVPGTQVNGVVEDMTLTTVKVRQFDNTTMTVSPLTLVSGSFQNWKSMQLSGGRRVQRKVYFDFHSVRLISGETMKNLLEKKLVQEKDLTGDAVNISLYRKYMEEWLRNNKDVNPQLAIIVRQIEATQCGLPLEFYFFVYNKEWISYEHTLADLMEHAYAMAPEFGLAIYQKYPSGPHMTPFAESQG